MLNFFKKNKNIKNDNGLNQVYSKNGKGDLIFEFTRVNGVIEGEAIHYREDGSIKKIENYKSGKLDGLTKIYDIYGVEIVDKLNYVNGEITASKKDIELKNIIDGNINVEVNWILGINDFYDFHRLSDNIQEGKYYHFKGENNSESLLRIIKNDDEGVELINHIIEKNGTIVNFKKIGTYQGWRNLYDGDIFTIGILDDEKFGQIIRINKSSGNFISFKDDVKFGVSEYDVKLRSLINGLEKISYNEGEGPENGRLIVTETTEGYYAYSYYDDIQDSLMLFKQIVVKYDSDHEVFELSSEDDVQDELDEMINSSGLKFITDDFELLLIRENVKYKFYITPPGGFMSAWKEIKTDIMNSSLENNVADNSNWVEEKMSSTVTTLSKYNEDGLLIHKKYLINNKLEKFDKDNDLSEIKDNIQKFKILIHSIGQFSKDEINYSLSMGFIDSIFWKLYNSYDNIEGLDKSLFNDYSYYWYEKKEFLQGIFFAKKSIENEFNSSFCDTIGEGYLGLKRYSEAHKYFKRTVDYEIENDCLNEYHLKNLIKTTKKLESNNQSQLEKLKNILEIRFPDSKED